MWGIRTVAGMRLPSPVLAGLAALATTAALAAPSSAARLANPSSGGPVAHIACTQAVIEGDSKCIAAGQFCRRSSRARRDYRRYGYDCTKRDRNGRYHLVRL